VVAATKEIFEKCQELPDKVPSLKHILGLALPKDDPKSYEAILAAGKENATPTIKVSAKDTACLIYTSGTTGNPKGVILSHGNIASNVSAIHEVFPMTAADRSLSFLPWAHSFGQTCELHALVSTGSSIAICEAVAKFIDGLGITVYEGYGLTETSPITTANWPGSRRIGSVGRAIPGVRVSIAADGEILVYGPNVMQGYHNRADENAAVFTEDGGF